MVRKKISKKEVALAVSGTLLVLLFLCIYVWQQTESISLGYDTAELELRVKQLEKEVEVLEAEKASLLSLELVEKMAREKLQLRDPGEDQILYKDIDPRR